MCVNYEPIALIRIKNFSARHSIDWARVSLRIHSDGAREYPCGSPCLVLEVLVSWVSGVSWS